MALIVPHGLTQVKATFGEYPFHELSGGNVAPEGDWIEKNVILMKNVAGTGLNIQMHKLLTVDFEAALKEAILAAPQYKIRMLGGFCARHQMHLPKNPLSIHSFAAAFDLNWDKNIVVAANASLAEKSAGCDMPKELVDVFRKHGWEWGGDWASVKDFMHFQYATGC